MTVWTFGDSWAEGHGLNRNDLRFGDHVANHFNTRHTNKGKSGSSLGHILHTFILESPNISKNDIVLVIIPPDIRWYEMSDTKTTSIHLGMPEFEKFLKGKTPYWFKYHHSLFMFTIINMCTRIDCKFILAHNYGIIDIIPELDTFIKSDYFLNMNSSLTSLLGAENWANNYDPTLKNDGPDACIVGKYFLKNDTHPNKAGHKKIGDLIIKWLEKYDV